MYPLPKRYATKPLAKLAEPREPSLLAYREPAEVERTAHFAVLQNQLFGVHRRLHEGVFLSTSTLMHFLVGRRLPRSQFDYLLRRVQHIRAHREIEAGIEQDLAS